MVLKSARGEAHLPRSVKPMSTALGVRTEKRMPRPEAQLDAIARLTIRAAKVWEHYAARAAAYSGRSAGQPAQGLGGAQAQRRARLKVGARWRGQMNRASTPSYV